MTALTTISPVACGCCHSLPSSGGATWSHVLSSSPPEGLTDAAGDRRASSGPRFHRHQTVISPLSTPPAGQLTFRGECRHTERRVIKAPKPPKRWTLAQGGVASSGVSPGVAPSSGCFLVANHPDTVSGLINELTRTYPPG